MKTLLIASLIAIAPACVDQTDQVDVPIPIHAVEVGGKILYGATYVENCNHLADIACTDVQCTAAVLVACCHGETCPSGETLAPSEATWRSLWASCAASIAKGHESFECFEILPSPSF